MQAFEKHKELADSIQFAAHNWKVNTGWTNHLEQINKVCSEHCEMLEMLVKVSKLRILTEMSNPHPIKEDILNLIKQSTK